MLYNISFTNDEFSSISLCLDSCNSWQYHYFHLTIAPDVLKCDLRHRSGVAEDGGRRAEWRPVIPARIKSGAATFPPSVFIDKSCTRVPTHFSSNTGGPFILKLLQNEKKCDMTMAKEAFDRIASGK